MDISTNRKKSMVRRFSAWRIAEHWVLITAFLVLAFTGLAQKFNTLEISRWLIGFLGGIASSRFIHHSAGIIFLLLLLQHVVVNSVGILFGKWPPSMLISLKDFQDALRNVKYYLGIENTPAQCDRYDYKEKFVYWLVLIGGIQMAVTGLILWFPILVTQYLPGQFIPAAKVMHTNEAMLIFLLIAIWHIYDSMFSPEVFPIDTSIFTGYIERKRMEVSHPLEVVRMDDVMDNDNTEKALTVHEPPSSLNTPAEEHSGGGDMR